MVESSCQEARQAWRCSNEAWPIGLSWNRPGKGDPQPTLTQNFASCTGTLPRTTPNTFVSNAQASKSLMHTPILRRNGFIYTQTGSIPRNTRISLATRGTTTDSVALFSVRMEPIIMARQFVEGKAEHFQERIAIGRQFVERRADAPNDESWAGQSCPAPPKKQASTRTNQTTSYFEKEDDDDTCEGGTYTDGNEDNSYAA